MKRRIFIKNGKLINRVAVLSSAALIMMSLSACAGTDMDSDLINDTLSEVMDETGSIAEDTADSAKDMNSEEIEEAIKEISDILANDITEAVNGTNESATDTGADSEKKDNSSEEVTDNKDDNKDDKEATDNTEDKDNKEASSQNTNEEATNDMEGGRLTAHRVVDEMVFGWNLGNTLDAFVGTAGKIRNDGLRTENSWGNPTTDKEIIDLVKSQGINVIRIPVTWYNHMDDKTYEIDEQWMNRVHEVVDYALDDNTYVIINVHHDTGTDGWLKASEKDLDKKKEILEAIWKQVGSSFASYGDHLLFEGFNEILNDSNEWSNPGVKEVRIVNDLNQIFVDTVRATGGNNVDRNLIVNTYCAGNTSIILNNFVLPEDSIEDGLIVEVHSYAPYQFVAPEFPNVKTFSESEVVSTIKNIHTKFVITDTPVIIGEFGCVPKGNEDARAAWTRCFVETATGYNIPCIWWDNGILNEYGIIDRKSKKVAYADLLSSMIEIANGK